MGHEGLDGEYLRALKTMGGSGVNWKDAIFRYCVVLLANIARVLGILYEDFNIWVFIIFRTLMVIFLFIWVLKLQQIVKNIRQ